MKKTIIGILIGALLFGSVWTYATVSNNQVSQEAGVKIGSTTSTTSPPTINIWRSLLDARVLNLQGAAEAAPVNISGSLPAVLFANDLTNGVVRWLHAQESGDSVAGCSAATLDCNQLVIKAKLYMDSNKGADNSSFNSLASSDTVTSLAHTLGAGMFGRDSSSNPSLIRDSTHNDAQPGNGILTVSAREFDGTNYERIRHSFFQSTTGVNANGAGTAVDMTTTPMRYFTMLIDRTAGATNAVEIDLECSLDGVIWPANGYSLVTITDLSVEPARVSTASTDQLAIGPCNYMRYNVVTVGAGNTLTIQLLATR